MASTRNRNTKGDYQLEQAWNSNNYYYLSRPYYGSSDRTFFPGNGLLAGQVYQDKLSSNGIDVESTLYGIGSTNLVGESFSAEPQLNTLLSLSVAEGRPVKTLLPEPLIIKANQRPYPMK